MGVKIRKRGNAFWLFIDHKGRRKARRVGVGPAGKKAAELAAIKIAAALASGDAHDVFRPGVESTEPPLFGEFATQWLRGHEVTRGLRPGSVAAYRWAVHAHLIPRFGTQRLDAISPEAIEHFIAGLRSTRWPDRALGAASVGSVLKVLRLVLKRAKKRGVIATSPADLIDHRPPPRRSNADPFTPGEMRAIFNAAHTIDGDWAVFLE